MEGKVRTISLNYFNHGNGFFHNIVRKSVYNIVVGSNLGPKPPPEVADHTVMLYK